MKRDREREGETEGERSVGWPYFLSGELYGAGLCVMTAEWIIISLSPSLSLFFSAIPLLVSGIPPVAPLYPARKLTPAESFSLQRHAK